MENNKELIKQTAFRMSLDTIERLDFLCSMLNVNRTEFVVSMIHREYDNYVGNPELQKVLAQMKDLESQLKSMMGTESLS